MTHVVPGEMRSNEAGKTGPVLKGMRILEGFLARSRIVHMRKLLTALWFRGELGLEAVPAGALARERC